VAASRSSEYDRDGDAVEVEDYLDCVAEARRAVNLSDGAVVGGQPVGVGDYLRCVDEARVVTTADDGQRGDGHEGPDGVSPPEDCSPGVALVRFCGRHGLERDGWRRPEGE
jgi:hypothetical protein